MYQYARFMHITQDVKRRLFLHEPPEIQSVRKTAVDVAGIVCGDAFQSISFIPGNVRRHLAVFDGADADALFEAGIGFVGGG